MADGDQRSDRHPDSVTKKLILRQLGNAELFRECRNLSALLFGRFGKFFRPADIENLPGGGEPRADGRVGGHDRPNIRGDALAKPGRRSDRRPTRARSATSRSWTPTTPTTRSWPTTR